MKDMLKKPLWLILTVSLILSLSSIWERATTEWNNNIYEFVVPYEEIKELAIKADVDTTEMLEWLKKSGVETISLEPKTLNELSLEGDVVVLNPERVREIVLLSGELDLKDLHDQQGIYIYTINETNLTTKLHQFFEERELQEVTIQNKEMLYIPGEEKEIMDTTLSYPDEIIDEIKQAGLTFVPRIPDLEEADINRVIEEVVQLSEQTGGRVMPSGADVFGIEYPAKVKQVGEEFLEQGYDVYQIEMFEQKGFDTLAYSMDMNVIRMHSIDLNQIQKPVDAVNRSVRAVKERNVRSLFLRFNEGDAEESLLAIEKYLQDVQSQMPSQFVLGDVKPFDKYTVSLLDYVFAFIAVIAFVMIATEKIFKQPYLTIAAGAGLALLSLAYLFLKLSIVVKAFALLIAIVTPIFAVLAATTGKDQATGKSMFRKYLTASAISFIGITIIIALLNGNDYLVGINGFKGVKLVYIVPIVFICLYAFYGNYKKIAKQPILYIHAVLAIVILALVAYYMSRTGNSGTATDLELTIRQYLEQWLYARPRTKEFLIGFPMFVLALYVYPRQRLIGKLLLIPGVIGFLSLVNTFTHIHIPLYVSIIRSVLGLAIGYVIGLLFIYIVKKATELYNKYLKQRCQS